MSIVSENIKYLRKLNGFTQEQFAKRIGIKRSTLGAYEEARAQPNIIYLDNMSQVFGIPVNEMLHENIRGKKISANKTAIYKLNSNASTSISVTPNVITEIPEPIIDRKTEPITTEDLPKPTLVIDQPNKKNPIEGTSLKMQDKVLCAIQGTGGYKIFQSIPECPDSLLVGAEQEDLFSIKDKVYYYLVTRNHGTRYCRVYNEIKNRNTLILVPNDRKSSLLELAADDILEVWEIVAYISDTPVDASGETHRVKSLMTELGKIMNG